MGTNWPVGGGGYLRLLPGWVTRWAVSAAQRRKQPAMIYLHPWELDPHQPRLGMKRLDRWRHRLRLGSTEAKLNKMLGKFCFGGAAQYLRSDQALGLPSYRYGLDVEAPAEVSAGREKSKRPGAL